MTNTTHEAPDGLVKRLRQPTGLNAFTQEPVQDKLKIAAADRIEELEAKLARAMTTLECYAGYWADDMTFIRTLAATPSSLLKQAADRIEQLAATNEELKADSRKTYEALLKVTRIHDEVEAKLAKAVEALESSRETILQLVNSRGSEAEGSDEDWVREINATLAELTGGNDD